MANLMETVRVAAAEGEDVFLQEFEDDCLEDVVTKSLDFSKCTFQNVSFGENDIKHLSFANCTFHHCDLSGMRLSDGSIHASHLVDCRGVGTQFDDSVLKDVRFDDCLLNYMTLSSCKLTNLTFLNTSLEQLMLHTCQIKRLKIKRCKLTGAEIVETSLSGVDLSTDELGGIRISPRDLAGAKISFAQTPLICGLIGVELV